MQGSEKRNEDLDRLTAVQLILENLTYLDLDSIPRKQSSKYSYVELRSIVAMNLPMPPDVWVLIALPYLYPTIPFFEANNFTTRSIKESTFP